jgi:hypothetical protein
MPHMEPEQVQARAAAIAAALGGDITDLTQHSAMIGFPDGRHEGLRVMIRFRTYGMAVGKAEASAYLPALNGYPSYRVGGDTGFAPGRPVETIARQIETKLLGPEVLAEAREIKAQRAKDEAALEELRAKLGTLTDAYADLRARLRGDTASFSLATAAGSLEFNMVAHSDDVQITHGRIDQPTLILLLDNLTKTVDKR